MQIQFERLWQPELLRRYNLTGPRYTSYPTAPQLTESFDVSDWHNAIADSNASQRPLSLYFHIPFCDTVCYYCACNKVITANKKRSEPYLNAIKQEIKTQAQHVDTSRKVSQLHWGGGTPTYLNNEQMQELMQTTKETFTLADDNESEYSIEIHPASVDADRIAFLRTLGFNRLSIGIQDFDPTVQKAVNRFNSQTEVQALFIAAREQQFKSISVDLIYGLPHQTAERFAKTLNSVIALEPDRLSIFNYAHMPNLFKVQKQMDARYLPEPQEKLKILGQSIHTLIEAGYVYIGMDHFAKPNDELNIAQEKGQLQRNFQGYSTHGNCDLLGFGVSSISAIANRLIQNHKDINQYQNAIKKQQHPIAKGFILSKDDLIRKQVIQQLICQFKIDFNNIETAFNICFNTYFKSSLNALKHFEEDKLIKINKTSIVVEPEGRLLIRNICMAFDAYLKPQSRSQNDTKQFSRIL